MKNITVSLLFVFIFMGLVAQDKISITVQRDSLYTLYRQHYDTVSVNTWVNIMGLNKYLIKLSGMDSLIAKTQNEKLQQMITLNEELKQTIADLKNQNDAKQKLLDTPVVPQKQIVQTNSGYFIYGGVAIVFLLIVAIALFISRTALSRKYKKKDEEAKEFHTRLQRSNLEIEKIQGTTEKMATEIHKLNTDFDARIEALNMEKSLAEEEKLMIENQIIEIKKAYDIEVQKRLALEAEITIQNEQNNNLNNEKTLVDLKSKVEENDRLSKQNSVLTLEIEKSYRALEAEVKKCKTVEEQFEAYKIELAEAELKDNESQSAIFYDELKDQNHKLLEEKILLDSQILDLKSKYENELKIRTRIENDLKSILGSLNE